MKVWVVVSLEFKNEAGQINRQPDEVMRLSGELPRAEVARLVERRYARDYQPKWNEASSTVDEKARWDPEAGEISVGHEPRFVARLVEDALN